MTGLGIVILIVGFGTMFVAYPSDRILTIGARIFGVGLLILALRGLVYLFMCKPFTDWLIWWFSL